MVNNDSNFVITGDNYNRFSDGKISIVDANDDITVTNSGNININGRGSNDIASGKLPAGIVATSLNGNTGDITVINSGNITSTNTGIRSWHQVICDINIDNSGDISIHSTSWGNAIYAARSVIAWKPYFLESRGNINI